MLRCARSVPGMGGRVCVHALLLSVWFGGSGAEPPEGKGAPVLFRRAGRAGYSACPKGEV